MPVSDFYALLFFFEEQREREEAALEEAKRGGGKGGFSARASGIERMTPEQRVAELQRQKAERLKGGSTA